MKYFLYVFSFFFVYVFMALDFSSTTILLLFCELLLCSKTVFSVFLKLPLLLPLPLFFLYLFIKRLCVCVSAFIICCVFTRVRACSSLILFCCFSLSFSFIKTNSLIYSQLKRKKATNSYIILSFSCACVFIPKRLLCVCVWFFSVDYRWVYGCLYFIYLYVCMCVVCDYHRHREKKQTKGKKEAGILMFSFVL